MAFRPDGKLLAIACGDGTVQLWNPVTDRPVATLHATTSSVYGVPAVAFSPDGKLLVSGGADGYVRAWNPATHQPVGAPLQIGNGPAGAVFVVAFSPDGKLLASAGARRHRAAVASIAIRAHLCAALRRRGTTDTARMEPLRLRRTAAEGLRLNPGNAASHTRLPAVQAGARVRSRRAGLERTHRLGPAQRVPLMSGCG